MTEDGLAGCIVKDLSFPTFRAFCVCYKRTTAQIMAKCSTERLFFLVVHSCNPISAPHFLTAADFTALLSFNQNPSFLPDALLPPLVRSVQFSSHSTATYSVCSLSVCVFAGGWLSSSRLHSP